MSVVSAEILTASAQIINTGMECVHGLRTRLEYINATALTLPPSVMNATQHLASLDAAINSITQVQPVTMVAFANGLQKVSCTGLYCSPKRTTVSVSARCVPLDGGPE